MPRRKKDAITGKPRPDWIAIKAMYLAGTKFCDLAKEFKVPEGTIKSRAYRFKWLGGEMSPRVIKKVQTQLEVGLRGGVYSFGLPPVPFFVKGGFGKGGGLVAIEDDQGGFAPGSTKFAMEGQKRPA